MSKVFDIAKALAEVLKANGFEEAEARSSAFLKREQATARRCIITSRNGVYDDGDRSGFDRVFSLAIVIQKAVTVKDNAADDDEIDALLDDVEALVALWDEDGPLQEATLAGAEHVGGPEHETGFIYEPLVLIDNHLFFSWTMVRYGVHK